MKHLLRYDGNGPWCSCDCDPSDCVDNRATVTCILCVDLMVADVLTWMQETRWRS